MEEEIPSGKKWAVGRALCELDVDPWRDDDASPMSS